MEKTMLLYYEMLLWCTYTPSICNYFLCAAQQTCHDCIFSTLLSISQDGCEQYGTRKWRRCRSMFSIITQYETKGLIEWTLSC